MQKHTAVLSCLALLVVQVAWGEQPSKLAGSLSATDFLPDGYVTDGSIGYQADLQRAIDAAAETGGTLTFPAMTYLLENEAGLTVHSGMTLLMRGAVFRFADPIAVDGQAFLGHDVTDVEFVGGQIVGRRDAWPDSVNIAGIRITGRSGRIRISDMFIRDLSSVGIGIFGTDDDSPIQDVFVRGTIVRNCCNIYIDYLQPNPGPAKGSLREDQGSIAMYHVERFVVHGCAFEGSRSDGTHFYHCRQGQFTDNKVSEAQMGGYFLEGCRNVLAEGNVISSNGSRGVTIERDSLDCTLVDNVIQHSGREGLWAPDVAGCLVVDNIFRENGRKDHDGRDSEIKVEDTEHFETKTGDLRIAGNLIYTTEGQANAVWITAGARGIVIENNTLRGPVRTVRVEGEATVRGNNGWCTEAGGTAQFDGDGKMSVFRIAHGLDFAATAEGGEPAGGRVAATVTPGSRDAAGPLFVTADRREIVVEFLTPPPAGKSNVTVHWTATE